MLGLTREFPDEPMIMIRDKRLYPLWRAIRKMPPALATAVSMLDLTPSTFNSLILPYFPKDEVEKLTSIYKLYLEIRKSLLKEIRPLPIQVPVKLTSALDDHPYVAQILWERIKEISENPSKETIIIVAHGPVSEKDNRQWLFKMESVARQILDLAYSEGKNYRNILCITVRDDAPPLIYNQAKEHLRALVRQASLTGDVLVVPLLLSSGGVETRIFKRLEGLKYKASRKMLLPHPLITKWIKEQVQKALGEGR